MSNLRKLQTEIDRVMKKVDEGVELFDEIWEKVYSAEQQNQKEKYEMDLKKEIKKLQRLRDQIKTWIGSSDVKDKDALIDARKLIETKMEQFKVCEKETKTKTYSKEGLARQEKLDPAEEAKRNTTKWIGEYIEKFNELVEDREVEIERLSAGKGKKTNKLLIEEYNEFILNHKYHINKLEGIMRLVNNDRLDVELVEGIKEDLDYYLEAYEEDDYIQSYDEEYFYESLGLDELDVVNVDRVTTIGRSSSSAADDQSMSSSKTGKEKSSKKKSNPTAIPLTIGRARATSTGASEKEKPATPSKIGRATSVPSTSNHGNNSSHSSVGLGPTPKAAPPVQTGGASMASILKRETEQQEKERQQKLQQQQLLREQQARAQQEQARQQQLLRQQQEQAQQQQLRQQEALRQQQQQQQQQAAQQEALKRQQLQLQEQQQQRAQQEAAAKQQQQLQAQQQAAEQKKLAQQRAAKQQQPGGGTLDILGSGLGGLSLGTSVEPRMSDNGASPMPSLSAVSPQQQQPSASLDANAYLAALNESFAHIPSSSDSERQRTYTPRNPFPTPSAYPSTPSAIFENPAVFEKLGTDCLFFIFYYSQGTYQQYLAARELKKHSWRYHKKYMTWFQRHEEPKVTTDEYEEGTYVYFDYETGWCQRIKSDFRFEYRFLEDSLA